MEWQPFNTAPKDGSLILIATRGGRPSRVFIGKYADDGSHWPWRVDQTNYHLHPSDLAHWMPLPEPPK